MGGAVSLGVCGELLERIGANSNTPTADTAANLRNNIDGKTTMLSFYLHFLHLLHLLKTREHRDKQ